MNIGEYVNVIDGSYSVIEIDGKKQESHGIFLTGRGNWKIVDKKRTISMASQKVYGKEWNDTIIEAYDGTRAYIQERFLAPVKPEWPSPFSLLYSLMQAGRHFA